MIGTAIVGGIAAASSIIGGIAKSQSAKRAAEKRARLLAQQQAENAAWYNRRMNEDFTQRSEVQAALERARAVLNGQTQQAVGQQMVSGGSNASVAAAQQAATAAYGNAVGSAAAGASAAKDRVENQYMVNRRADRAAENALISEREAAKEAAIDTAVAGVNGIASAYMAGAGAPEKPAGDADGADADPADAAAPAASTGKVETPATTDDDVAVVTASQKRKQDADGVTDWRSYLNI